MVNAGSLVWRTHSSPLAIELLITCEKARDDLCSWRLSERIGSVGCPQRRGIRRLSNKTIRDGTRATVNVSTTALTLSPGFDAPYASQLDFSTAYRKTRSGTRIALQTAASEPPPMTRGSPLSGLGDDMLLQIFATDSDWVPTLAR